MKITEKETNIKEIAPLTPSEIETRNLVNVLGEDLFAFYFDNTNFTGDVRDLLSDCVSDEKWAKILESHKEGLIDTQDLVDVLKISHVQAIDHANPSLTAEDIVVRTIDTKIRGKLGRKLIGAVVNHLEEKNLLTSPQEARKLLSGAPSSEAEEKHDLKGDYKKNNKERTTVELDDEEVTETFEDMIMEEYNSPDIIVDRIKDITFDELMYRLGIIDDIEFDLLRHVIFDFSFEGLTRNDLSKQSFCFYRQTLENVFVDKERLDKNEKIVEREITRFIVSNDDGSVLNPEQVNEIIESFKAKYITHMDNRLDTSLQFYDKNINPEKKVKLVIEPILKDPLTASSKGFTKFN